MWFSVKQEGGAAANNHGFPSPEGDGPDGSNYVEWGYAYLEGGKDDKAEKAFEKGLVKAPLSSKRRAAALLGLSVARYNQEKYQASIQAIEEAEVLLEAVAETTKREERHFSKRDVLALLYHARSLKAEQYEGRGLAPEAEIARKNALQASDRALNYQRLTSGK